MAVRLRADTAGGTARDMGGTARGTDGGAAIADGPMPGLLSPGLRPRLPQPIHTTVITIHLMATVIVIRITAMVITTPPITGMVGDEAGEALL
jgi:hypothetical protein